MGEETNLLESGLIFFQERFLKALLAQTIFDKVSWRQTGTSFYASSGVFTEVWETIVGGTQIALKYQQVVEVAGRFLGKAFLKKGGTTVDISMYPKKTNRTDYTVNPSENEALCHQLKVLCLQLYEEIKEQRDRMTRKWRKENISDIPDDVSDPEDVIIFLADKLGMPEITL